MSEENPSPEEARPTEKDAEEKSVRKTNPQPGAMALPEVERQLEAALKDIPEPKRDELRSTFLQVFMAFVQRGTTPPTIDAETAKILADSANKEHGYRHDYMMQQLKEESEESKRDDAFRTLQHSNRFRIVRPCAITALIVIPFCLFLGIYLASTGHETLGTSILTGVTTSFLAFIAGLSTGNLIKDKSDE